MINNIIKTEISNFHAYLRQFSSIYLYFILSCVNLFCECWISSKIDLMEVYQGKGWLPTSVVGSWEKWRAGRNVGQCSEAQIGKAIRWDHGCLFDDFSTLMDGWLGNFAIQGGH